MIRMWFWISSVFFVIGCQAVAPGGPEIPGTLLSLPNDVGQAVLVKSPGQGNFQAKLSAWERKDGTWRIFMEPVDAVIGRNGLAPPGEKKEGDGRSPSGIFDLRRAFGYDADAQTKLVYRQVTGLDIWVDDPGASDYNQWATLPTQAKSFEYLKREDNLYKYAVVIEYNTAPVVPGSGSAIFLHIWRGPDKPTSGCVAISKENLLKLISRLNALDQPGIILEK